MSSECQSRQLPRLPCACHTPAAIAGCALLLFFGGGREGKILHLQTWLLAFTIKKSLCESSCSYQYQCHLQISADGVSGATEVKEKENSLSPKDYVPHEGTNRYIIT